MAVKVAGIFVEIGAVLGQFKGAMSSVKRELVAVQSVAEESSASLRKAGLALTVVSYGIARVGKEGITTFMGFEQSIANVASVLAGLDSDFEKLERAAREAALVTIYTANQAADAMYILGSAGLQAGEIFSALEPILALAAATQSEIAETARLVVANMVAFQIPFEQTARVANVFAAAISDSQATLEKLRNATKFVAPVARAAGLGFEEMTASLSKLLDAGLRASTAGVYMRGILLSLQNPTIRARRALDSLGLSVSQVSPQFNTLVDIVRAFEKAGAAAIDKGDELSDILGRRYTTAMQVLIRMGADELENFTTQITNTNKAFSLQDVQIKTLRGSFLLLKSAIQDIAISFGHLLRPAIDVTAKSLRGFLLYFKGLPTLVKAVTGALATLAAVIVMITGPLLLLAGTWKILKAGILSAWVVLGQVGVALGFLNPWILAAVAAVTLLTAAFFAYRKGSQIGIVRPTEEIIAKNIELERRLEATQIAMEQFNGASDEQAKGLKALAILWPSAVTGHDQLGRAAAVSTEKIKALIEVEKKLAEARRVEAIKREVAAIEDLARKNKYLGVEMMMASGQVSHYQNLIAAAAADDTKRIEELGIELEKAKNGVALLSSRIKDNLTLASSRLRIITEMGQEEAKLNNIEKVQALIQAHSNGMLAHNIELVRELLGLTTAQEKLERRQLGTTDIRTLKAAEALNKLEQQIADRVQKREARAIKGKLARTVALENIEYVKLARSIQDVATKAREMAEARAMPGGAISPEEMKAIAVQRKREIDAIDIKEQQLLKREFDNHNKRIKMLREEEAERKRKVDVSAAEDKENEFLRIMIQGQRARAAAIKESESREIAKRRLYYATQITNVEEFLRENTELEKGKRQEIADTIVNMEEAREREILDIRKKYAQKQAALREKEVGDAKTARDKFDREVMKKLRADPVIQEALQVADDMISSFSRNVSNVLIDSLFGGNQEAKRAAKNRMDQLDEFYQQQRVRMAGNTSALIELERQFQEERQKINDEANDAIGNAWARLWDGIRRDFVRNVLDSMSRSIRRFVTDSIKEFAKMQIGKAMAGEAAGGGSKLGTAIRVLGFFAGLASGNPQISAAALMPTGGFPGASGVPEPTRGWAGKPAIGPGTVINLNMSGAMLMMDNPEQVDNVVRNIFEPSLNRIANERVAS